MAELLMQLVNVI